MADTPIPLKPVDEVTHGAPEEAVHSGTAGQPRNRAAVSVPETDPANLVKGQGLLSGEGRGVVSGRPYDEQLLTERTEVEAMHKFSPGGAAKLRAATKRALGR